MTSIKVFFYPAVTGLPDSSCVVREECSAVFHAVHAALATLTDTLATDASEHLTRPPPLLPLGQGTAVAASCTLSPQNCWENLPK